MNRKEREEEEKEEMEGYEFDDDDEEEEEEEEGEDDEEDRRINNSDFPTAIITKGAYYESMYEREPVPDDDIKDKEEEEIKGLAKVSEEVLRLNPKTDVITDKRAAGKQTYVQSLQKIAIRAYLKAELDKSDDDEQTREKVRDAALKGLFVYDEQIETNIPSVEKVKFLYCKYEDIWDEEMRETNHSTFWPMFGKKELAFAKGKIFLDEVVIGRGHLGSEEKDSLLRTIDSSLAENLEPAFGTMKRRADAAESLVERVLKKLLDGTTDSSSVMDENSFMCFSPAAEDPKVLGKEKFEEFAKLIDTICEFNSLSQTEKKKFDEGYKAAYQSKQSTILNTTRMICTIDGVGADHFDTTFRTLIGDDKNGVPKNVCCRRYTTFEKVKKCVLKMFEENNKELEVYFLKRLYVVNYAVGNQSSRAFLQPPDDEEEQFISFVKQMITDEIDFVGNEKQCATGMEKDEIERCARKILPLYWKHVDRMHKATELAWNKMLKISNKKRCLITLHVEATQRIAPGDAIGERVIKQYCLSEMKRNLAEYFDFCARAKFEMVVGSRWLFRDVIIGGMKKLKIQRVTSNEMEQSNEKGYAETKWLSKNRLHSDEQLAKTCSCDVDWQNLSVERFHVNTAPSSASPSQHVVLVTVHAHLSHAHTSGGYRLFIQRQLNDIEFMLCSKGGEVEMQPLASELLMAIAETLPARQLEALADDFTEILRTACEKNNQLAKYSGMRVIARVLVSCWMNVSALPKTQEKFVQLLGGDERLAQFQQARAAASSGSENRSEYRKFLSDRVDSEVLPSISEGQVMTTIEGAIMKCFGLYNQRFDSARSKDKDTIERLYLHANLLFGVHRKLLGYEMGGKNGNLAPARNKKAAPMTTSDKKEKAFSNRVDDNDKNKRWDKLNVPEITNESFQSLAETYGIEKKESTANGNGINRGINRGNTTFWELENVEELFVGVEKYMEKKANQKRNIKWGVVWNILSPEFQQNVEVHISNNWSWGGPVDMNNKEKKCIKCISDKYNNLRLLFHEKRDKGETCYANVGEKRLKEHYEKGGFWKE
ncbi:unknown protein [Bathycoccus prasinos]|uniref:Uncharacterized protein n=1 Tax=Bathycoccus prasinos TaxID=41875 RepID=K8EDC3_9CHLO|nr:unknown protein [Bathycoccus prasinos]CCO15969.1 unknown protein [Bathycoccus prasinos]|eukprot:XP_007513444.1 unknown protein [Bathycoccus prasinos]